MEDTHCTPPWNEMVLQKQTNKQTKKKKRKEKKKKKERKNKKKIKDQISIFQSDLKVSPSFWQYDIQFLYYSWYKLCTQ